ncbi:MAG: cobalamin B12-binding domain-containing protein [Candidatus Freyarchaeota archaeon]|nr:cobalamin B12-binding domain-containing protein [Candidatus Jordarchaeia archaeon]MBS7267888.1 cobalamin B12-binding domain-containing protein [Candidatus Jordarchaeia archaeon]MBS7279050.1 cobalamin B12-binding domain-containing protein [Candidatus Jordarchaeia archaeon]
MPEKQKIRFLMAKPGLDGHDRGAKVVSMALRDAGMEVIYTGLHQTPEQIVEAAIQEDADVIGLSILSGAHMTLIPRVLEVMRERGISDRLVLAGGTIVLKEDIEALKKLGVAEIYGPGTPTKEIVEFIYNYFEKNVKKQNQK